MVQEKTNLSLSRKEAEQLLNEQIRKGKDIKNIDIESWELLKRAESEFSKWNAFNITLLQRIFDTSELSKEYAEHNAIGYAAAALGTPEDVEDYPTVSDSGWFLKQDVQERIEVLESIKDRLALFDEPKSLDSGKMVAKKPLSNRVFIVHGHDAGPKQSVARLLEKLGLEPIILHEKPSEGRTIIEKIEKYSDVDFAIVLLTGDDEGRFRSKENLPLKDRARQNVIFELGFFFGKLGRGKVCTLYKEGVERPSDYEGIVYISLDERGAWQRDLAKELKAVGFEINADKLL